MVTYTTQEKYAVINILIQIIEADTIIHEKEIEYMNQILSELSITLRDIEYIEELDTSHCINIVKNMAQDKKDYAVNMFRTMISIDNRIDPRELAVINDL